MQIDWPPEKAWLDRVIVEGKSLRPDFVCMRGSERVFWIEVELGLRNTAQLARYKRLNPTEVRSIVGLAENLSGDASLEQISKIAVEAIKEINGTNLQATAILSALVDLIDPEKLGGNATPAIYDIPIDIAERFPIILAPLLDLMEHGLLINRPTDKSSLSLRLTAKHYLASKGSFALLSMRDGAHLLVPTPEKMECYLKHELAQVVSEWEPMLDSAYPPWKGHQKGRSVSIPYAVMEQHADVFARFYTRVRDLLVSMPAVGNEASGSASD